MCCGTYKHSGKTCTHVKFLKKEKKKKALNNTSLRADTLWTVNVTSLRSVVAELHSTSANDSRVLFNISNSEEAAVSRKDAHHE